MRRPGRTLVLRTTATSVVVGAIVGMVATFGTRSAVDVRYQLRASSRAVATTLVPDASLGRVVRAARLYTAAVVDPQSEVVRQAGDSAWLSPELVTACTARDTESWMLSTPPGAVAWCSGLALWPQHSLITVAPQGLRRSRFIGLAAGLFAASLTGLVHLWLWVPPARRELDDLEAQLGDRAESLGRLAWTRQIAAIVAHEVRNPLQSLTALIDLMAYEPQERDRRDLQQALEAELETIEVVIRRLVDSKDELEVIRRTVELEALIDSCIEFHLPMARRLGVTLRLLAPRAHRIALDPPLVRRALENILVNALEALEDSGHGSIEVTVLPGPRSITVHIDDSGPGVEPEDRLRLFEPGYSRRPGGTGLGLFLAARVAESHGGTLRYGQSPLGGARFSMTLPRTETA